MLKQKSYEIESIILNKLSVNNYLVVGTMSAGKSTFLNSLIGFEMFPSKNEACTAKVISYYANPAMEKFLYLKNNSKRPYFRKSLDAVQLEKWNKDDKIQEIKIEGPLKNSFGNCFGIIDTPGPNNSMDKEHKEVMKKAINKFKYSNILYLLNASQLGTEDDQNLLHFIKENCSNENIHFVVNKSDVIDDTEAESLTNFSNNVQNYLMKNGFKKPKVFFVSSLAGLLAMKVKNKIELTRKESSDYRRLQMLLDRKLSDYNLNISNESSEKSNVINSNDPLWVNSGISEILNKL
ncbi:dynamin family protein [Bacillus mobilis]|uniref:dynamin family protein n=1 Tax=Bacillus mobilis TaxID=2026190 RepID=UPI002E2317FA|nr:dynamin family protein [Bacillus mobilis]MED1002631.1 dynamin family protein [Bacillus mobilis]